MYYYSLSRGLTLVYFLPLNMCCFIVGLSLDVEFEIDIEADAVVWHSDIDPVNALGLIAGC
jgi:hypothetical protein